MQVLPIDAIHARDVQSGDRVSGDRFPVLIFLDAIPPFHCSIAEGHKPLYKEVSKLETYLHLNVTTRNPSKYISQPLVATQLSERRFRE